jgi:hypothetical protein
MPAGTASSPIEVELGQAHETDTAMSITPGTPSFSGTALQTDTTFQFTPPSEPPHYKTHFTFALSLDSPTVSDPHGPPVPHALEAAIVVVLVFYALVSAGRYALRLAAAVLSEIRLQIP